MDEQVKKAYESTLRDLEGRCADTQRHVATMQAKLKQLHQTAQTIAHLIAEGGGQQMSLVQNPDAHRYSAFSVRWAILCLLTESSQPFSVQEIADALLAGGIRTEASNFPNNVSSVLSQMRSKLEPEVATADGKWVISDTGRSAWNHIRDKHGNRLRRRFSSYGTETPDALTSGVTN
jgi:hypothetical protein